jgi:hypothetical protein
VAARVTRRATSRASRVARLLWPAVLAGGLAVAAAGCGIAASTAGVRPTPTLPAPSVSVVIAATRREISAAVAKDGLQLDDAHQPYRPPETSALAAAPRAVLQVVLPDDQAHGYIVVYEFRDEATAAAAGREQAAYIGSGPGKVQFPPDTQHLIRQLGTTVITYSWSPANSTDARAGPIFADLSTVGLAIDIPR